MRVLAASLAVNHLVLAHQTLARLAMRLMGTVLVKQFELGRQSFAEAMRYRQAPFPHLAVKNWLWAFESQAQHSSGPHYWQRSAH